MNEGVLDQGKEEREVEVGHLVEKSVGVVVNVLEIRTLKKWKDRVKKKGRGKE